MDTALPGHRLSYLYLAVLLLCSCSEPARYVIVSERLEPVKLETTDQRLICLATSEAEPNTAILGLRTKNDIERYVHQRPASPNPVEHLLYLVIRAEYAKADELLRQSKNEIPLYLKLLLSADLASEDNTNTLSTGQLINRYQEAFDIQPCTISRSIMQLRIRQVRYGR